MINLLCKAVERIVSSGIDGKALVPLLLYLIWVAVGQVDEVIDATRQLFIGE